MEIKKYSMKRRSNICNAAQQQHQQPVRNTLRRQRPNSDSGIIGRMHRNQKKQKEEKVV